MLVIVIPGPVAQDKDWARAQRVDSLMPSMQSGLEVCIDFSEVQIATQSFIHALLSEPTRIYGEEGLGRLEFRSCSEQVRVTIETVVTYTFRARDLAAELGAEHDFVRSSDIPQADDLQKVRTVVEILIEGPMPVDLIAELTNMSIRHAHYRVNAARILGLLQLPSGIAVITERGRALTGTQRRGTAEQRLLKDAISASVVLRRIAPGLLGRREPSKVDLADKLRRAAKLSPATAARRAQCLLSWRRQVLTKQLVLPGCEAAHARSTRLKRT